MGTIIVASIIGLVIVLVITKLVRDKKQGKSCCGGNCSACKHCHH